MSFAKFFEHAKKRRIDEMTDGLSKNSTISPRNLPGDNKKKKKSNTSKRWRGKKNKQDNIKTNIIHKTEKSDILDVIQTYYNRLQAQKQNNRKIKNPDYQKENQSNYDVSQEALDLSTQLKELSNKKQLKKALSIYNDPSKSSIRDGHHGSIMIDCCARCGDIKEGEEIFKNMILSYDNKMTNNHGKNQQHFEHKYISVQAFTALMKGYAHSGQMDKGFKLYQIMCSFKERHSQPNVRTFNTFLRGCLWTASSSFSKNSSIDQQVPGGVMFSEEAWNMSEQKYGASFFDTSSYEYSISLLCQALRVQNAEKRIKDFIQYNHSNLDNDDVKESLATAYLALSRAYALLGNIKKMKATAKKTLATLAKNHYPINDNEKSNHFTFEKKPETKKSAGASGGKRGWRNRNSNNLDQIHNRSLSNQLFRGHRKSELMKEAKLLCSLKALPTKTQLTFLQVTRLLYFSGGGTTELDSIKSNQKAINTSHCNDQNKNNRENLSKHLLQSLWSNFGLASLLRYDANSNKNVSNVQEKASFILSNRNIHDIERLIKGKTNNNAKSFLLSKITPNEWINFGHIFSTISAQKKEKHTIPHTYNVEIEKPIYMELGSGSGDWIISQANANPNVNYMSVELRADRVAQTFAKATLNLSITNESNNTRPKIPLMNLCCCGAECGSFLRERIPPNSISRIYVNHPEPPIQNGGQPLEGNEITSSLLQGSEESAHMLNSSTLEVVLDSLRVNKNGDFIIVTDNRWYAHLICQTIVKVINTRNKKILQCQTNDLAAGKVSKTNFEQKQLTGSSTKLLRPIAFFPIIKDDSNENKGNVLNTNIILYEGQPCAAIGHIFQNSSPNGENGTSYFDRLWRTGAGRHAEAQTRFIIALQTTKQWEDQNSNDIMKADQNKVNKEVDSTKENDLNKIQSLRKRKKVKVHKKKNRIKHQVNKKKNA